MTTPAEQTVYTITSTGDVTYTIPMWIYQIDDIAVFFNGAIQDPAIYSISSITYGPTASFSLTFSAPPAIGVELTIARDIVVSEPADFTAGSPLTAEDLNYKFNVNYLIDNDFTFYSASIFPKYTIAALVDPTDPVVTADLELPKLSTPGVDDSPRVWAKDSTGVFIDAALDPSGITASELKDELAVDTSAVAAGATLVGYFDASLGGTTVQAAISTLDAAIGDTEILARYTADTGKRVVANSLQDEDATSSYWALFEAPSSVGTFATECVFGDASGAGTETMYTMIGGTHIRLNTAGTGGGSTTYPDGVVSWSQGSPAVPIAATGITDTALATKGFVVGTTPTFTRKDTPAEAEAAAAADVDPLHFYWAPT